MSTHIARQQGKLGEDEWVCAKCGDDMPCRDYECPFRDRVRATLEGILEACVELERAHTLLQKNLKKVFHALRKRPN